MKKILKRNSQGKFEKKEQSLPIVQQHYIKKDDVVESVPLTAIELAIQRKEDRQLRLKQFEDWNKSHERKRKQR